MTAEPDHWTLDRRVPVALIVALLAQGALGVWFLSDQAARVAQLEREALVVAARVQLVENRQGAADALYQRLDERTVSLIEATRRIEALVQGISRRGDTP